MNAHPIRENPEEAPTAADLGSACAAESGVMLGLNQVESLALEALTEASSTQPIPDVGMAEDGRSDFVTESIDGPRIDEYCDAHRMDVPSRLRLFLEVCKAVHLAHQHAMIHRHLEPGHIRMAPDGVPKVLGFGIAGRTRPDPGLDGTGPSETLAPEYASPEQVSGEPVTTAGDIYALGVLLYQHLTGRWPYRLEDQTTSGVFQAICEQVPERPSAAVARRPIPHAAAPSTTEPADSSAQAPEPEAIAAARSTTAAQLKRMLRGDLDAIVLMALRKEPERRYASTEALADDLRCYLDGLPVRARGESFGYRTARLLRRYPAATAAGVVLILALMAALAGSTWGLIVARRERTRAEESSRRAREAVDQFYTRFSEDRLFDQPGLRPLRKTLLQDAQRFYQRFLDEHRRDPALRDELALASRRVAAITGELGAPARAIPQLEQAVELWESLAASDPDDAFYRRELAGTLNDLGRLLMREEGRRDDALRSLQRAQELLASSIDAEPRAGSQRRELSRIHQNIASLQRARGEPEEAVKSLASVLAIESQRAAEDPDALDPKLSLAGAHNLLGQIFAEQPEGIMPALESSQKAVEILEAIHRDHPDLAEPSYLLARNLGDLSLVQQMAGKLDSALKSLDQAVGTLERLDRQYPRTLEYQGGLGSTYNMLSELHRRRREPAAALAVAQKALDLLERLVAEHPKDVDPRVELARAHNNNGRVLQQAGDPVGAQRAYQRAVDTYESLTQLDPRNSYGLATNITLCIRLIGARPRSKGTADGEALTKADHFRRKAYGDRAMDLLLRAVQGGFANLDILQSDDDLDPIRDRPDFQDLIKTLEKEAGAAGPE